MSDNDYRSVDIGRLRLGAALEFPIYDVHNVLLLAKGHTITPHFLERLRHRGVETVRVHSAALESVVAGEPRGTAIEAPPDRVRLPRVTDANDRTRELDSFADSPEELAVDDELAWHDFEDWGDVEYDFEVVRESVEHREAVVGEVADAIEQAAEGGHFDVDRLDEGIHSLTADLIRERHVFAALGINPTADTYPARHSVQTCMVALALGSTLGLSRTFIRDLGLGCLIHDSGMLRTNGRLYEAPRRLTDVEFVEIARHPVHVFDMLTDSLDFPRPASYVAYQMHERLDGSGYPRGTKGVRTHDLAKIAAVADTYVGLVSPRPHRPALIPHHAIRFLLENVQRGKYDSGVVRGLLSTISLFPLGSLVRLSDGRIARTIRTNGDAYDRPTVQIVGPGEGTIVNLTNEPELKVSDVLPPREMASSTAVQT